LSRRRHGRFCFDNPGFFSGDKSHKLTRVGS
jgi:mRNA interferase HicA